jgi:hypothetical protein
MHSPPVQLTVLGGNYYISFPFLYQSRGPLHSVQRVLSDPDSTEAEHKASAWELEQGPHFPGFNRQSVSHIQVERLQNDIAGLKRH